MKLSIVIPAYNEENYLGRCLESIIRETKNSTAVTEIIVVNNASTDRTGEIARNYKGVIVVNEPVKGLTRARQAGFLKTTGDLIGNIDADAILPPDWIEKAFKEFSENPRLVCLSGPHIYYDLPKRIRILVKIFYGAGFIFYIINKHLLRIGSLVQGGNFVVRKSALEKIGGYDTAIDFYGEDTDIARRLSKVGDVKFTFSFPIYISGRRISGEGALRAGFIYALNYFWVSYFRKPFHSAAKDFRPNPPKPPASAKIR